MSHFFQDIAESPLKSGQEPGRDFQGNGASLIPLPGCRKVKRVFINGVELPESITEDVLVDTTEARPTKPVQVPLWRVVEIGGVPNLQRGVKSNDGIWQSGARITVIGDFGKASETPKPSGSPKTPEPPQTPDKK